MVQPGSGQLGTTVIKSRNISQHKKEGFEVNFCNIESVLFFVHRFKAVELHDSARGLGRRNVGGKSLFSGVTGFLLPGMWCARA